MQNNNPLKRMWSLHYVFLNKVFQCCGLVSMREWVHMFDKCMWEKAWGVHVRLFRLKCSLVLVRRGFGSLSLPPLKDWVAADKGCPLDVILPHPLTQKPNENSMRLHESRDFCCEDEKLEKQHWRRRDNKNIIVPMRGQDAQRRGYAISHTLDRNKK